MANLIVAVKLHEITKEQLGRVLHTRRKPTACVVAHELWLSAQLGHGELQSEKTSV